ncbi:MAG: Gfo/Idh/MocA family oxidoreductase [Proteobacteria bacterium]|nr:Gfo/Idh/MocA family oxidoreductase [Pseudomonadota bacterium]
MDTIRIGLIGAGGNTRSRHIPGFKGQEGVELVTVANRTVASAQRVADEFGIPDVAADWREVLEDETVDAVCIGTWPYMHAPLTIAALQHGKHVLCEARMALNSAEGHEMLATARQCPGQIAQIVPAPHTLAFDQTIVERIASGGIGELIAIDARVAVGSNFPDPSSPMHWRNDRDLSGNNIMSMGIWYEAMMRWVGPAASVFAIGQSVVNHRIDAHGRRAAMTVPDHIDVVGAMAQGGQIRFNVSTVVGHAPALADIHIFGTEGTLRLHQSQSETMALHYGARGDSGLAPVKIDPAKQGDWRVEEEFINAIRGVEEVTPTDFQTAVKYMEWTDAVAHSAQTGERVSLPLS